MMFRLSRWIDTFNRRIAWGLSLLMMGMVLVGVWNVVGRFIGRAIGHNLSSNALIEGQWYLFAIIFLCGGGYTLLTGNHVRVDVFYGRLTKKQKAWVDLLGSLVFAIPFCLLAIAFSWGSIWNSWSIWETSPDPDGLPRYLIKSVIPIGLSFVILQAISEAIKNLAIIRGITPPPSPSPPPPETPTVRDATDLIEPSETNNHNQFNQLNLGGENNG